MISPKYFVESLKKRSIDFYTGVPDSLLKNICAYITDHLGRENHIIPANEGAAIGLASGYYLATGKIPVVYMQNSGIGNAVNPLLSLTDKEVYDIPVLLLVGWRGEPGVKDEPQHVKQGKVTIPLLETMGIKNVVLSREQATFDRQLDEALTCLQDKKESFAFIIQKDTFEDYKIQNVDELQLEMSREDAIKKITSLTKPKDVIVSTTGMISRELFEFREQCNQNHEQDFLTVGSMGHASQIALGIALQKKDRNIYCFDGDGATLMHMGGLPIVGSNKPTNFIHVVFNNGAHDSVGGQPTVGFTVNLPQIALASGYESVISVENQQDLDVFLRKIDSIQKPIFLEVKVRKGARKDLGRPTTTPIQNKESLMNFLKNNK